MQVMILDNFSEAVFSQSVESIACLSMLIIAKYERRDELNGKLVNKRELELKGLGNSQPVQIVYSENRAKDVAGQGFSKEDRHVTLFKRGYKNGQ